jgi:hypothetical protein
VREWLKVLTLTTAILLGNSAINAETSTRLSASQVRATYAAIKAMAKPEVKKNGSLVDKIADPTDKWYHLWADFGYCDTNDAFLSEGYSRYKDGFAIHLISGLAIDVSRWREDLPAIGYPVDVWKPLIDNFETKQLDKLVKIDFTKSRPKKIKPDYETDPVVFHSTFENE